MIKLPSGIDINNLIDDIRIFSWQAADILLYYSRLLEKSDYKRKILKNNNEDDPVTLADLKVNELIIKRINEKYKNVKWDILSEENVKISSKFLIVRLTGSGFLILLMERRISFKQLAIMQCIWH